MIEVSKELAEYIRKHAKKAHIYTTVHRRYAEETALVKKLIKRFESQQYEDQGE